MGIFDLFRGIKDTIDSISSGVEETRRQADEAAEAVRERRGYGADALPKKLPTDLPVCRDAGFHSKPSSSVSSSGDVSLEYEPRAAFDKVIHFYDCELKQQGWKVRERREDESEDSRSVAYEVKKGKREGGITVNETTEGSGLRRTARVSVSISIGAG